jgi:hypothetical protein
LRTKQAEISSDLLKLMRERNRLDSRVHDYAEELLNQAIAAYGPEFQTDLAELRRANEALERSQSQVPNVFIRGARRLKRLLLRALKW